jgi:hypothetical protein
MHIQAGLALGSGVAVAKRSIVPGLVEALSTGPGYSSRPLGALTKIVFYLRFLQTATSIISEKRKNVYYVLTKGAIRYYSYIHG